jgi:hypothetical protein
MQVTKIFPLFVMERKAYVFGSFRESLCTTTIISIQTIKSVEKKEGK